jgi:hypothetical protein
MPATDNTGDVAVTRAKTLRRRIGALILCRDSNARPPPGTNCRETTRHGFSRPCERLASARDFPLFEPLSWQRACERQSRVCVLFSALDSTAIAGKRRSDLHARVPWSSPGNVSATVCGGSGPCADRRRPLTLFGPKLCPCVAAAALHPRAWPLRDRSQLPAWQNGRRACLRGYGAFPHGQTRPPACWMIFLREHLLEHDQGSLFLAYMSLRFKPTKERQVVASSALCSLLASLMEFSGRGRAAFLRKYASISGDLTSGLGGERPLLGGYPRLWIRLSALSV